MTSRGCEVALESESAFPLLRLDICSVCVVGNHYLGEEMDNESKAAVANRLASRFLELAPLAWHRNQSTTRPTHLPV